MKNFKFKGRIFVNLDIARLNKYDSDYNHSAYSYLVTRKKLFKKGICQKLHFFSFSLNVIVFKGRLISVF